MYQFCIDYRTLNAVQRALEGLFLLFRIQYADFDICPNAPFWYTITYRVLYSSSCTFTVHLLTVPSIVCTYFSFHRALFSIIH